MNISLNRKNILIILLLSLNFIFCSVKNNKGLLLLEYYPKNQNEKINNKDEKVNDKDKDFINFILSNSVYVKFFKNFHSKKIIKFLMNKEKQNSIKILFQEYNFIQKEDQFFKLFENIKYIYQNLKLLENNYSNFNKISKKYFNLESKLTKSKLFKDRRKKYDDQIKDAYTKIKDCENYLIIHLQKIKFITTNLEKYR